MTETERGRTDGEREREVGLVDTEREVGLMERERERER